MENFQELLTERLYILVSASFVFLLLLSAAWKNGYFSFRRIDKHSDLTLPNKIFLGAFAIFLILQLFVIPILIELWHHFYLGNDKELSLSPELQGWVNIFGILVSGLGMLLYFFALPRVNQKIVLGSYALKGWKARFQDFFIAAMSWILSYPLVVAIGQIVAILLMLTYQNVEPEQTAVKQVKAAASSTSLLVLLILSVITIVPIIEEFLFRGFLQNWLKKFMGQWKAVASTSFIFALFHFTSSQGMGNIELIVSLFVLSCFLGFIYERQKSLWAPISLHAIFNAVSIILIFYVDKE